MPGKNADQAAIVLFDGVCLLCQGAVKFIIKHDPGAQFKFASLQSDVGRRLLQQYGGARAIDEPMNTMYLLERESLYTRSSAALKIAKKLKFPWPLLYALIIVPQGIRDAVYRWVANNRYRWFGKSDVCMLPANGIKERFLDL
ncbi:thiol-disulfide oxidoreductase DCC family protein [Paenibacillus sp. D2_2]|uniref:thiol-disulfide oxidoreductase DCC family protein n=1 Tax=Paenibacillus sp. D2_2 TaxID=3073092 RepID=UPI002815011E|nr:thiol-disulfide oxidoreductase DCC family protein [Paenibacillus sp. D2_2]WMT39950.1 thiol-disulfide oxidoreductase DCC family protein [Paenibacillus sp. D2_2]